MPPLVLLCIDDRSELLELRKAAFERLGCSVITAANTLTAIAMLQLQPIAAVLLEYKCEGMDAEAVVFHIKQRFPAQPVILLSAYSEMPERVLWLVDEYVMKSEPPERVVQVVERITNGNEQPTAGGIGLASDVPAACATC